MKNAWKSDDKVYFKYLQERNVGFVGLAVCVCICQMSFFLSPTVPTF